MQEKIILFIGLLLLPILSIANESESKIEAKTEIVSELESMKIKDLIEKAKVVSSQERIKIENLIKKRIAKAHRENYIRKRG